MSDKPGLLSVIGEIHEIMQSEGCSWEEAQQIRQREQRIGEAIERSLPLMANYSSRVH
jgi:hypothetical protein